MAKNTSFTFLFPELPIFIFCWGFYFSIGYFFARDTLLVYHPKYVHDLYLGFDDALQNTSFVRHPLLKILAKIINTTFAFLVDKSFLIVSICSCCLALQMAFIYKILKQIVLLSFVESILILALYSVFSTNLILSFSFESYTFSTFLLPMFFYFIGYYEKNKMIIPSKIFYFFAILVGGITITNLLKTFAGMHNYPKSILLKRALLTFGISGIMYIIFSEQVMLSISHSSQFIHQTNGYFSSIFYLFFGGGIVFPELTITDLDYENSGSIAVIIGNIPNNLLKTLLITIVLFLVFTSFVINFRKPLVKALLLSFCVDIIIHLIIGLGLNEAQIFSGNFVFIFPIMIGFLLKNQSWRKVNQYLITSILIITFGMMIFINLKDLAIIYNFGITNYPKL